MQNLAKWFEYRRCGGPKRSTTTSWESRLLHTTSFCLYRTWVLFECNGLVAAAKHIEKHTRAEAFNIYIADPPRQSSTRGPSPTGSRAVPVSESEILYIPSKNNLYLIKIKLTPLYFVFSLPLPLAALYHPS
jgi:hypothetical protein